MTLSPTALEAAAKAVSVSTGDEPDKLTYAREMQCSGADREPQYRWQYWTQHATAAITAYLAQAGKEGWVLVPAEPTEAMRKAGYDGEYNRPVGRHINIYRAMIAARPSPGAADE